MKVYRNLGLVFILLGILGLENCKNRNIENQYYKGFATVCTADPKCECKEKLYNYEISTEFDFKYDAKTLQNILNDKMKRYLNDICTKKFDNFLIKNIEIVSVNEQDKQTKEYPIYNLSICAQSDVLCLGIKEYK
ncbi:MAG: hypothetical protein QXP39_01850 [Candidatus Aenigmatarchaeota archaeon]